MVEVAVSGDVRAEPGTDRSATCAAGAGLIHAAIKDRKIRGEVCVDCKNTACQPAENVIPSWKVGPTSALPTRIGIRFAVVAQNGYSDARN